MLRRLALRLTICAEAYLAFLACLLAWMFQPPTRFALGMAKFPEPLFAIVPFRSLWSFARAGHLRIGEPAEVKATLARIAGAE